MQSKFVVACTIAVVATAAFLPGAGLGSSAVARSVQVIPEGLTEAIHARLGAAPIRLASGGSDQPQFGVSVALSADGTTALVGAYGVANEKGAAYIYHAFGADSWASTATPAATLTRKPGAAHQWFGVSVALSADGTTAFVGAPLTSGGVEVFHVSAEDAWASTSTPTATLTANGDELTGVSVAASPDGTTLVAGIPFHGTYTRAADVFHVASEEHAGLDLDSHRDPELLGRAAGQPGVRAGRRDLGRWNDGSPRRR